MGNPGVQKHISFNQPVSSRNRQQEETFAMVKTFALRAITCFFVALSLTITGCMSAPSTYAAPATPSFDIGGRNVNFSSEQVRSLAVLTPAATRTDVVAVLGEPSFESRKPTQAEVASATGEKPVVLSQGAQAMEAKEQVVLSYIPGGKAPGSDIRALLVFLTDGRFSGYVWLDSSSVIPEDKLISAKPFVESPCDKNRLMETLGTPVGMGQHPDGGFIYRFAFDAPADVKALDLPVIELVWLVSNDGSCVFNGLSPDFIWRYGGMSPASAAALASIQKAENDYYGLIQTQKTGPRAIRSGAKYQRVLSVLNILRKNCIIDPGPVELYLLDDPEIDASAGNGSDGAVVCINIGLLDCLSNDSNDELAFVLGHECGHLVDHHTDVPRKYISSLTMDPQIFKWSRCWEHAADIRGLDIMVRAGYDPQAAVKCVEKTIKDKPSGSAAFDTHPLGEMRIRMLRWYIGYRGLDGSKK